MRHGHNGPWPQFKRQSAFTFIPSITLPDAEDTKHGALKCYPHSAILRFRECVWELENLEAKSAFLRKVKLLGQLSLKTGATYECKGRAECV